MTKKGIKKVISDWAKGHLKFGNKIACLVLKEHRIQIHFSLR